MSLPRFVATERRGVGILSSFFFLFLFLRRKERGGKKRNPAAATWRYANPIVVNCQRYGLRPVSEEEPPSSPLLTLLFFCPPLTSSCAVPLVVFLPLVAFRAGFYPSVRYGERHLSAKLAWLTPFHRRDTVTLKLFSEQLPCC